MTSTETARLLAVSADTVLKWVKAGKIESYRTPGGHCRIPRTAIQSLLPGKKVSPDWTMQIESGRCYCWEFNSKNGHLSNECRDCLVYRSRAARCYEMRDLPGEAAYLKSHCTSDCEDCDYFQLMEGRATTALLVTADEGFARRLREEARRSSLQLRTAASEYECATVVENFRPDYVIVDRSLGIRCTRDICAHLSCDPRIPFTRLIMTSRTRRDLDCCDREIFGWMHKPFNIGNLEEFFRNCRADRRGESTSQ